MATEIIHRLIDDLDGSEAEKTHFIRLNDDVVEIDLSTENGKELAELLAPYFDKGRRPKRAGIPKPAPKAPKRDPEQLQAMRDWANNNGWNVSPKGRIPIEVEEAYTEAHKPKKSTPKKRATAAPEFSG
ncbi:DNA bridging protein [Mycobacterium phage Murica]|nr:DNA bridging protein [Mycobacterium phage Murica]